MTWLVSYDVRDPRRLKRVHRLLSRRAASVQYSAFVMLGSSRELESLLSDIECVIDAARDDVRAYHLPERCQVWTIGAQHLPAGVYLDGASASKLLLGSDSVAETLGLSIS